MADAMHPDGRWAILMNADILLIPPSPDLANVRWFLSPREQYSTGGWLLQCGCSGGMGEHRSTVAGTQRVTEGVWSTMAAIDPGLTKIKR